MNKPIRAFVGHSFTSDDEAVVTRFTKYFDQLANLYPNFSWTHAEPAEPKVLADKVMQLIDGANLFIGICTKKERVVAPSVLSATIIPKGFLKAREGAYSWKTSDWIIQEIGLAKGRGLDLMLLVEDGLRQPGGLQGNLEYISFSREAPEKAFGKIVEMLTALVPKVESAGAASPEPATAKVVAQDEPPAGTDWVTPKLDWKRGDYEFAVMHLTFSDDDSGVAKISKAYLDSAIVQGEVDKDTWAAFQEHIKIVFRKGGDIDRLNALADKHPKNPEILGYLANGYERYGQHAKAASLFVRASEAVQDSSGQLEHLRRAAIAFENAQESTSADGVVEKMKSINLDGSGEMEVLEAERALAELRKQDDFELGALERLVEISPSDNDRRFSLAYKYSETEHGKLALSHYIAIPTGVRTPIAWNNLGVAYDQLDVPIRSVSAYRKAEQSGETLSMSNLANKFLKAGFIDEARVVADAALAKKDFHANVAKTLSLIKESSEEEDKKVTELLQKSRPMLEFYRDFGRAMGRLAPASISSAWKDPNCVLAVAWSTDRFQANGSYERPMLGIIARAMLGESDPASSTKYPRMLVEYQGTVRGCAIVGTVTRQSEEEKKKPRSFLDQTDSLKVLGILSDDGKEIRVFEHATKSEPRFYSLVANV
jgi:tetratricopeptide (TPR) repeat protein